MKVQVRLKIPQWEWWLEGRLSLSRQFNLAHQLKWGREHMWYETGFRGSMLQKSYTLAQSNLHVIYTKLQLHSKSNSDYTTIKGERLNGMRWMKEKRGNWVCRVNSIWPISSYREESTCELRLLIRGSMLHKSYTLVQLNLHVIYTKLQPHSLFLPSNINPWPIKQRSTKILPEVPKIWPG